MCWKILVSLIVSNRAWNYHGILIFSSRLPRYLHTRAALGWTLTLGPLQGSNVPTLPCHSRDGHAPKAQISLRTAPSRRHTRAFSHHQSPWTTCYFMCFGWLSHRCKSPWDLHCTLENAKPRTINGCDQSPQVSHRQQMVHWQRLVTQRHRTGEQKHAETNLHTMLLDRLSQKTNTHVNTENYELNF